MQSRSVDLHYFSGTGNTYLVARTVAETLTSAGIETRLLPIDPQAPARVAPGAALGLAFPVAYQSTYPFLWRYFQALPPGQGGEAFMVDTLGGFSGAIVGRLQALVLRKGYRPIGACEIRMPLNFGLVDAERMRHREVIERGLAQAERYALDLAAGRAHWGKLPVLADLAYGAYLAYRWMIYTRLNQRWFRLRNDAARCVSCGRCARSCPVANIALAANAEGRARPLFGDRCEFCLKCVALCPQEANRFILNPAQGYRAPGAIDF